MNLSHNRLHVQSGKEIGKMLETNIGLKTLNLAWNLFYPEDGEPAGQANLSLFMRFVFSRLHSSANDGIDEKCELDQSGFVVERSNGRNIGKNVAKIIYEKRGIDGNPFGI